MASCTDIRIYYNGTWFSLKNKKIWVNGAWQPATKGAFYYNGTWYNVLTTYVNITPTTASVDYNGRVYVNGNGNYDLSITVSSNDVKADGVTKDFDWATLEVDWGYDSNQISLTFSANPNTTSRSGTITVATNNGTTAKCTVTQDGKPNNYFTADETNFACNMYGAEINGGNLILSSNEIWTIYSKTTWIRFNPTTGSGTVHAKIYAAPNPNIKPRLGTVVLKTPSGLTVTLNVTQDADGEY